MNICYILRLAAKDLVESGAVKRSGVQQKRKLGSSVSHCAPSPLLPPFKKKKKVKRYPNLDKEKAKFGLSSRESLRFEFWIQIFEK